MLLELVFLFPFLEGLGKASKADHLLIQQDNCARLLKD